MWALRMLLCCATHSNVYNQMLCCSVLKRRRICTISMCASGWNACVSYALTTRLPFMHTMHSTTVCECHWIRTVLHFWMRFRNIPNRRFTANVLFYFFTEHGCNARHNSKTTTMPRNEIQLSTSEFPPINTPVIFWKFENDSGPTLPIQCLCLCIPFKFY